MRGLRKIAFVHIPKCAGTSVVGSISKTYFPRHRRLWNRLKGEKAYRAVTIGAEASAKAAESCGENLQAVRSALFHYWLQERSAIYISGHVPFSEAVGRDFVGEWDFVTIVREPVDRFFSEYFYNKFKPQEHFRVQEDIDEFLAMPDAIRLSSQLVNFLTGRRDVYCEPSAAEVAQAIDNLKLFSVVGVMEDMPAFCENMRGCFGKGLRLRHVNRNPAPEEFREQARDASCRRRVEELSIGDIEVYEAARRMLRVSV